MCNKTALYHYSFLWAVRLCKILQWKIPGTWSVSVCLSAANAVLALQAMRQPMSDTNVFRTMRTWKNGCNFPETTAFERYAVKTSEKDNMQSHQLTSTYPLALCTLRRHNKSPRRSSCIGMLSYSVTSPCQTLCDQLAWRPQVSAYS